MFSCLRKFGLLTRSKFYFINFINFSQMYCMVYKIELLFLSLAKPSGKCSKWNNDDLIKTGPFQGKIICLNSGSFISATDSD